MDYTTTSYTQNTPSWLWEAFKTGPADLCARYEQAVTALIAAHVLRESPEVLSEQERRAAVQLANGIAGVEPCFGPPRADLEADEPGVELHSIGQPAGGDR